jgi:hypothetical protein
MSELHITTTRYAKCLASCATVKRDLITEGCAKYAETKQRCSSPPERHMGQTISRNQCPNHRDEGFAEYDTR